MDKIALTAFVLKETQDNLQEQYKEYLKSNKWIPFIQWFGSQIDSLFNTQEVVR